MRLPFIYNRYFTYSYYRSSYLYLTWLLTELLRTRSSDGAGHARELRNNQRLCVIGVLNHGIEMITAVGRHINQWQSLAFCTAPQAVGNG